jgi:type IV pilus assembly protein PilW
MNTSKNSRNVVTSRSAEAGSRGFSLVELMISIVIGLVILAAMVALFINTSGGNREMARANGIIESGRLAIELLENDITHGGYWGGYMPTFDDQTFEDDVPGDTPTAIPDPCLPFATPWTAAHITNLIGIPVQVYDAQAVTDDGLCADVIDPVPLAGTDVLIVRHAELCAAGSGGNCEADTAGVLYMQSARCADEVPDYVLATNATSAFPLTEIDCDTEAEKRKFVSNIYWIRDFAVTAGDGIPTLVRSEFDLTAPGGALEQQPAEALVEGIEGFRVELGVDSRSKAYAGQPTGTLINYGQKIDWLDPKTRTTPRNRGDGTPDGAFVSCSAAVCTVDQLMNTTAVKLFLLVRSREPTPGYTDDKTYTLGGTVVGPFGDGFKRHVYETTVRLPNIAGRRQTP